MVYSGFGLSETNKFYLTPPSPLTPLPMGEGEKERGKRRGGKGEGKGGEVSVNILQRLKITIILFSNIHLESIKRDCSHLDNDLFWEKE